MSMLAGILVLVCAAACQNCMSPAWRCSATQKQRWEAHCFSQSTFTHCGGPAAGAVSRQVVPPTSPSPLPPARISK